MKIDIGSFLSGIIPTLIKQVQISMPASTGAEKHAVVVSIIKVILPIFEGLIGEDLINDAALFRLIDKWISAQVTVLKVEEELTTL